MDQMYLEVGENSVRSKMDKFWDSWQELSNHPSDLAPREAVISRGETLIDSIHERFLSLKGLQDTANSDMRLTVERLNELSSQIASVNGEIERIRAQGDNPNDLMDRRDLLVDKLSSIIDITVDHRDSDEFMVHTGGNVLIQGSVGRQFLISGPVGEEGYGRVMWQQDARKGAEPYMQTEFRPHRGSLAALIEMRDSTIEDEIQNLDNMTMNFIDLVNEAHSAGYGLNGRTGIDFFNEHHFTTNVQGNYDRDGDGAVDSTYLFRINGLNTLEPKAQLGIEGTVTLSASEQNGGEVNITYYATDTVDDIIGRINRSGADVTARLDREGHLSLKATPSNGRENPDFVLRHIEDSGYFLADYAGILQGRGPEAAYDWGAANAAGALRVDTADFSTAPIAHPSGWIEVNATLVRDKAAIASGYGENGRPANPGNGEAALAIAAIRNNSVMVGAESTFDDYFADATARIGMLGEQSGRSLETENVIMKQLHDMRESISGVNMDEELAAMIKYQHGYSAAARFVTTVNAMLDTLITRFG
jgi:flagellar hook-associated protein 1 FlgK